MNKKVVYTLVAIVAIIAVLLGIKWYINKDNKRVSGGSDPNQEDKDCASGGLSGGRITGICTKPKIYPVKSPIKQKCFTSDELGLNEGDLGPEKVTDNNGWGTTWYFNFQSGDRFCYINKQI